MSRSNLHIYQSPLTHESRILKITKSIADAGVFDKIVVAGVWQEGLPYDEALDKIRSIRRIRTRIRGQSSLIFWKIVRTVEWMIRAYREAIQMRPDCVNCHSLVVLPLGVAIKRRLGCRLIYDTHELETETSVTTGFRRRIAKWLERTLISTADHVVVVGDEIGNWYRKAYPGTKVSVVRNVPMSQQGPVYRGTAIRKRFGIRAEEMVFLYQGLIDDGRGIDLLCRVFSRLSPNKHVVFMGYGSLVSQVEEAAARHGNIHYHPAVAPGQVSLYTGEADVGLSLIENVSLSYYYSVPNKLFEYINCGVPVIVSDFPEMSRIVDEHLVGWKTDLSEESVQHLIDGITREGLAERTPIVMACRGRFVWENEVPNLLEIYGELFPEYATGLRSGVRDAA